MERQSVLVVVHPGSLCGSANFNLGRSQAQDVRAGIVEELQSWPGGVVVIDGSLSDELSQYRDLQAAIDDALKRAKSAGAVSVRLMGSDDQDFDQVEAIRQVVAEIGDVSSFEFDVTGAWYHPEDESGCIGAVTEALRELGASAFVSESAACLSTEDPEDDKSGP